jgi:hypothetical protein
VENPSSSSYEPPDGEEIGSLGRLFRQFHGEVRLCPGPMGRISQVVALLQVATP